MSYMNTLITKDRSLRSLEGKYRMVDTLYGGTDAMRAAGEQYLPKSEAERDVDYANRLKSSTLFNYYKEAVLNATYAITARDFEVQSNSDNINNFIFNVDLEGRSLREIMFDLTKTSIHYGVSYMLVDYYKDEYTSRPYFVDIKPTQVISIESTRFMGSETLTSFLFAETINDDVYNNDHAMHQNTNKVIDQVREYTLDISDPQNPSVVWAVYRMDENGAWTTFESDVMQGQDRIPIIPLYSNRISFYMGEPTFIDLAELNIRHWQSYSDQSNLLHYARFPILFAKGIDMTDEFGVTQKIEIGANTLVHSDNPNADLAFVEHSGAAVDSGWKDIEILQTNMQKYIKSIDDSKGSLSEAQSQHMASRMINTFNSISERLEIGLQQAMVYVAEYYDEDEIPVISIKRSNETKESNETKVKEEIDERRSIE